MNIDAFREFQRGCAPADLASLLRACRRRFVVAAQLLCVDSAPVRALQSSESQRTDVWALLPMHAALSERYIDAFFSPQVRLFPDPKGAADERWNRYFHHVLVPNLVREDEVVRNVLRATGALPSRSAQSAAASLIQYVTEMTLPETQPAWAPEFDLDY